MQALLVDRWWSWIVPLTWQLAIWVALIAGLARLARNASPRVRYLLWSLVLVKVFLPPSLAVNWGFGHWGLQPLWEGLQPPVAVPTDTIVRESPGTEIDAASTSLPSTRERIQLEPRAVLFAIWLLGVVVVVGATWWQYRRLVVRAHAMRLIDEGPVRIALERLALKTGLRHPPELLASSETASPFLFGLLHPRIVLPESLMEKLSERDIEGVLLHELNHCRRGDLWVGALQAIVQSLLWFHPLVWWANARLRQERECACDQDVLSQADVSPSDYGQSLLSVLAVAKGRAIYQANLAGVFEPGANIQQRLEEIMKDQPRTRTSALWYLALASLLVVFLPMAAVNSATQEAAATPANESERPMPAWIVETSPAIGAIDVDPNIKEITVTFDRDMGGGMSWTGGGPEFPGDPAQKAFWRDERVCVLPVKLEAGRFYRVGINSKSYENFRSVTGNVAPHTAIYFVTKGPGVPEIVKMVPENGATDVDPATKALRITFNMPMGKGMSWVRTGGQFPELPADRTPKWSSNGKTCILPVSLKGDQDYEIGINDVYHINFQSKKGIPLSPVIYKFTTTGGSMKSNAKAETPGDKHLRALVEDFFKHNFRDVTKRKTIEWGPVETDANGNRSIRYKYYASIWDKEVLIMNQVFTFDAKDEYIGFVNVEGFPVKKEDGSMTSGGQTGPTADQDLQQLVEKFFKNNFRDVTQRKTIEWGSIKTDSKGNRSIRYKYYASIRDKELLVMNQVFTFNAKGEYVGVVDVEGFPQTLGGESVKSEVQ